MLGFVVDVSAHLALRASLVQLGSRLIGRSHSTMTTRVLNVAEKNDVAKNVANILSRGSSRRREGYSVYNKIFEFNTYVPPLNAQCSMVMTSVSGHLLNYDFANEYSKWYSCDPKVLFNAPITHQCSRNDICNKIQKTLESEAKNCSVLVIWTDCDREGENIGFEIIKVCRRTNPNLKVLRAHFSEITVPAITRALNGLTEPDKKISDAVDVRQQLDLRIGAAFTRFLTLGLKSKISNIDEKSVISYGSCQFPTLGFVVERYLEHINFKPQPFWLIDVVLTKDKIKCNFKWKRNHLFDERACLSIFSKVLENPEAKVTSVKPHRRTKRRPFALDTVTFERLASSKLRITAKKAMSIAEKLYTSGLISYPRTETNKFPPEIKLNDMVAIQSESSYWGSFAKRILDEGGATPRNGNKSDQAHPPIHPLKPLANNLNALEKQVYELITRHFLACCHKDAIGSEVNVVININEEFFTLRGLHVEERNYLEVYPYERWAEKEIPRFAENETFTPDLILMNEGKTTAPDLLTESELIALMDKHGIGTDATHAEHIEKIKERKYISETRNRRLIPEGLGIGLVEGYNGIGFAIAKPFLRAALEKDLQQICLGAKDPQLVLQNQITEYKKVFEESAKNKDKLFKKILENINQPIQPAR